MPERSARPLPRRIWDWITFTRLRMAVVTVITLALVLALSAGAVVWDRMSDECGSGVYYEGQAHECIGVTDGSYVFAPALADVERAILAENQSLGNTYATIVLLLPMTSPDPATQAQILHSVQGAYAAQYRANHQDNGEVPPIRLLLANPGLNGALWPYAVRQLESMTGAPDNVRAVVGIGISTDMTKAEVQALTAHHMPVVGGSIAADDIANPTTGTPPYPGLARVSATAMQMADALTHLSGVNPRQTVLVEDTRTDDDYISSLVTAFSAHAAQFPVQPYTFTSPPDENQIGDTANTFQDHTVPDICETPARWIYFAGRQVQLAAFINMLAQRPCSGRAFTILTGSAASHLASVPGLNQAAFSHGIALEYAAIASPDAWTGQHVPATGGSPADYQAFTTALSSAGNTKAGPIGPVSLTDGETIINYDAAWTGIAAIRLTDTGGQVPSPSEIAGAWSQLNGPSMVGGASGWICLDNAGNPYDKAIPVDKYSISGKPVFATLAWPSGSPPQRGCQIPPGG